MRRFQPRLSASIAETFSAQFSDRPATTLALALYSPVISPSRSSALECIVVVMAALLLI